MGPFQGISDLNAPGPIRSPHYPRLWYTYDERDRYRTSLPIYLWNPLNYGMDLRIPIILGQPSPVPSSRQSQTQGVSAI